MPNPTPQHKAEDEELNELMRFISNFRVRPTTQQELVMYNKDTKLIKQAIFNHTQEATRLARIDELKHLVVDGGLWHEDEARDFPQKITVAERLAELDTKKGEL